MITARSGDVYKYLDARTRKSVLVECILGQLQVRYDEDNLAHTEPEVYTQAYADSIVRQMNSRTSSLVLDFARYLLITRITA
jgi:hypothetical protein